MYFKYLHKSGGWRAIISLLLFISIPAFVFSQTFTAKLISADGESWGQTSHTEKTSKGNTVYIGEKEPSTFNTTAYPYIKARLAYLSNDKMGSCSIRSIQRTTFADGSNITSDPSKYYRKTCLSESYDKDWLDWSSDAAKTAAININTTYPAIVYAYSVADGDIYDVFFYVSDDSDPFVEGTCKKLFKVGPDEYEGKYEDLSGLAHWYFEDVSNLEEMFSQCGSLKKVGLSGDFSLVSSLKNMFYNCASIEEIEINGDFGEKLTSLEGVFTNCTNLKSITLGGEFKNVTNINSLFKNCTSLEEMSINGFFSTKLTQAANVFEGCELLESISIHKTGETSEAKAQLQGDFSKVMNIANSFKNCTSLKNVEIAGDFSSLTSLASLFSTGNANLETATIKGDFPNLTTTNSMFRNCPALTSVKFENTSETTALTNMQYMFGACPLLKSFSMNGKDADAMMKGDFSKATTLQDLFNGSTGLEDIEIKGDLSSLTNITSLLAGNTALKTALFDGEFSALPKLETLFSGKTNLTNATLKGDFSSVGSLKDLFLNCSSLTSATLDANFTSLTNLQSTFNGCSALPTVTLKGDFSNVSTTQSMFNNCKSLTSATLDGDFGAALTSMRYMFGACELLESVSFTSEGDDADVSVKGDFSGVTTMQDLFNGGCSNLKNVTLAENFSSLTNIGSLFANCTALKTVNIDGTFSSLTSLASLLSGKTNLETATIKGDFSALTNVNSLFNGCSALTSADIDFEKDALTNMASMFKNCSAITFATIGDGDEADVTVKGDFSKVTTLQDLFNGCSILEDVKIKEDFPLLTNIGSLFTNCPALKTVDIDGTFSSLTSLASLFSGKKNLEKVLINGSFDELTTMQETFKDCDKITTILFNTDGDADVKITGTFPKLETMNGMFRDCDKLYTASLEIPESVTTLNNLFKSSKLTSANVSNVGNVTTMESMFCACSNLTDVSLSGDFSNVETTKEMFNNATKVSNITLSGVSDTDTADFSSLVNVNQMFNNWTAAKDDVLADFMGQIIVDTLNLLGGFNNNYKINNNSSFTAGLAVKTANGMVYNVTSSDRNPSGKYLVFNSEATLLPIELSYFTLSQDGKDLFFEWETATETNNDYFTIEQSIDGVSFHEVARIAGAGTSSTSNYYEYSMLATFSGLMYFRLKQTDYNGDYSYSDVQTIFVGDNEYVILYPTIATDFITIEGDYESVKFIDMQGKIQHPTRMQGNSYPIAALPQGMHYAIISLKNGEIVTRQFFKK